MIKIEPVAFVKNSRKEAIDDNWGPIDSEITLAEHIPTEAFNGIEAFSHLEIVFHFDQAEESKIVYSGRPRGNPDYPVMGIFGQRKKDRPNRIGLCTIEMVAHKSRTVTVKGLDAIDGTPVLDIKPVFREFQPKGTIMQPDWVAELLKHYW